MATSEFDRRFWEKLISYIDEGQVVPIVGQELLSLAGTGAGAGTTLYQRLARGLAQDLNADSDLAIPLEQFSAESSLSDVACAYKGFRNDRGDVYLRIKRVLDCVQMPIPLPLQQLAQIEGLRLFVSTTFDSFLEQALNLERFGGRRGTVVCAYSPNENRDLNADYSWADSTVVYQLMGRVSSSPSYAVTDEDMLEFMHSLLDSVKRPKRLLDELQKRHLLFLGNSFSDWLERFLVRSARYERLWKNRDNMEVVADGQVQREGSLAFFFNHFSHETRVFREGTALDFVQRLHEEWKRVHPDGSKPPTPSLKIPAPDVFISYANGDVEVVRRIAASLEAVGVAVWFDKEQLEAGDTFSAEIQKAIGQSLLFIPIVSANTEQRPEAYFRKEWYWAKERVPEFTGTDRAFLLPVVLDGIAIQKAQVPEEFKQVQCTPAPGGTPPPEFPPKVRELIRAIRKGQAVQS